MLRAPEALFTQSHAHDFALVTPDSQNPTARENWAGLAVGVSGLGRAIWTVRILRPVIVLDLTANCSDIRAT